MAQHIPETCRRRAPCGAISPQRLLVVICLAAAASSPSIFAQGAQTPFPSAAERLFRHLDTAIHITPGVGLGEMALGTPMAAVPELWGRPLRSERSGILDRRTTLVYKSGIDSWIVVEGDRAVDEIGIQGRSGFATPEGVRFGTPRHQVRMIYGAPDEADDTQYRYRERGIGFVFRSGTVYQMRVFEAERGSRR